MAKQAIMPFNQRLMLCIRFNWSISRVKTAIAGFYELFYDAFTGVIESFVALIYVSGVFCFWPFWNFVLQPIYLSIVCKNRAFFRLKKILDSEDVND